MMVIALVFVCLVAAVVLGQVFSRRLAERHLTAETRDTIKLSLGLVATMSALLLGLLVSSAKSAYDSQRQQVDDLAAKVTMLDRVLALYGAESAGARQELKAVVQDAIVRAWPEHAGEGSDLRPDVGGGDAIYVAIQRLMPADELQRELKGKGADLTLELAEGRALLLSRALVGVSTPLLAIVVGWLFIILFGFSMLAPRNAVATSALATAAFAVSGAILLLLEYYEPFDGLIRISSRPMVAAISGIAS
jgi:uncharacterized membrane protein YfcA